MREALQTTSGSVPDAAAESSNPSSRTKRGGVLGTCAADSPFRECRGGEALEFPAWSYDPFDQANYSGYGGLGGRAVCEGWVREALRRLDRNDGGAVNLPAAVRQMRTDANTRRDNVRDDMLARVDRFQDNESTLALRRYAVGPAVQFNGGASRGADIRNMFQSLRERLGVNDVAHLRIGAVSPGSTDGQYGHALIVQRVSQGQYAVFDPNNGAFVYQSRRHMETALRRYMDDAFNGTGLQFRPDSIQYYTLPASASGATRSSATVTAPPLQTLREPPVPTEPRGESPTRDAYSGSADMSNLLSSETLSAAAGQRRVMSDAGGGLMSYALRDIAHGRSSNLTEATENIRQRLSDPGQRPASMHEINDLQEGNRYGLVGDIQGRIRHSGASGLWTPQMLTADLRERFGRPYVGDDARVGYADDFAVVNLAFRGRPAGESGTQDAEGHSIVVQRLHRSSDVERDHYELYDSNAGVFRYSSFADLSGALDGLYERGYGESGGIAHADTTYYANINSPTAIQHDTSGRPLPAESPAANLELDAVERRLNIIGSPSLTAPRLDLPPPPLTVEPPAYNSHVDLKRSTDFPTDRKPGGLFRPSTVSPQALREHGGFDSEHTKLRDINLNLHNFDVASNPRAIDSAGYLGTFRSERTAASRMPGKSGDGYIYFIAPTPNMVDVNASLGSRVREPESNEVAAMGWIDYPQIRGWRVVKNGVPGAYVRNPDYRWDVYDQTQTAGAQLQLSRFPVQDDAWREEKYKSFVSDDGGTHGVRKFNEDPNMGTARFYDNAWQKVRDLNTAQEKGEDYRGPLQIQAYDGTDRSDTHIYLDGKGTVYVNTAYSSSTKRPGNRHDFTMGDDGRFHVVGDYGKVLRVDSEGYVYAGEIPADPASRNGACLNTTEII